MKSSRLISMAAVILICVAAGVFWMKSKERQPDGVVGSSGKARLSDHASRPEKASSAPVPSRGDSREDSWEEFRAVLANESTQPLTAEGYEQVTSFLSKAVNWSRKDLKAAAEEVMAGDLSAPQRAGLFGGLLDLLSAKDGESALELYDRAWETAGFNRDGGFYVHEMVLNLADQDPDKAAEWVESRRGQFPEHLTELMLEKIRKAASQ